MTVEWRPDTCSCILRYDELLPSGDPNWRSAECELCGIHPTPQAALNSNRSKNQQQAELAQRLDIDANELGFSLDQASGVYDFFFHDPGKNTEENRNKIKQHLAIMRNTQ